MNTLGRYRPKFRRKFIADHSVNDVRRRPQRSFPELGTLPAPQEQFGEEVVCLQLIPKGSILPAKLGDVDDHLRRQVGCNEPWREWCAGWLDAVGLKLALGRSWDEIRAEFEDLRRKYPNDPWLPQIVKVAAFLEEYYDVVAWDEGGE